MVIKPSELQRRVVQNANDTEDIYGILKTVNKTLTVHTERLDGIDTRLDGMDTRLDGIDTRLDGISGQLSEVLVLLKTA